MRPRVSALLPYFIAAGCTSEPPSDREASARASAASETAPVGPGPDVVLQERLRRAARDVAETDAARGPSPLYAPGQVAEPTAGPGSSAPRLKSSAASVEGRLPPEVIQRIVRQNHARFRSCYAAGLEKAPDLRGRVTVTFTISSTGAVGGVKHTSDLADLAVAACVARAFGLLSFPPPDGGVVRVTYPIDLSPAGAPEPAPAPRPASAADSEGPWPIVSLDAQQVRVDGQAAGSVAATLESGRVQKIEALLDRLTARREEWVAKHRDRPFPGIAGLRAESGVPALALKSVFKTMALAGYAKLSLQSAAEPRLIVEVAPEIEDPFSLSGPPAEETLPQVAFLDVSASGIALTWRRGSSVLHEQRFALDDPLGERLCASWSERGAHREATDLRLDRLVLRAANDVPSEALVRVAGRALTCERTQRVAMTPDRRVPAFWIQLTTR